MHGLSHGFHPYALLVRKEYEYLVRGIRAGIGEKIELIATTRCGQRRMGMMAWRAAHSTVPPLFAYWALKSAKDMLISSSAT